MNGVVAPRPLASVAGPPQAGHKARALFAGLLLVALVCGALGVWQVQRRAWKLDLIARVESRIHAAAVEAPAAGEWPRVSAARDAYRRVQARGVYLPGHDTPVQAATTLGGGHWVLSPLRRDDGSIVLVNRGFLPGGRSALDAPAAAPPAGPVTVTGLLRVSEPGGAFLRANDPARQRYTSRDVVLIAEARGLGAVAPYFIDADAAAAPMPGAPVGGLTVVAFRNPHAVYALTWFTLAAMAVAGAVFVRRVPRGGGD